ncbi:MAG: four helix bundle protein [Ginsengibacter sp.]
MSENIIRIKSYAFALRIINLYKYLKDTKKEFILSKQLLRSGTGIGALVREADNAESKPDFIHKMSIGQKECDETLYWIDLLYDAEFLTQDQYNSLKHDGEEILKIIRSIIIKTKQNLKK